MVEVELKRTQVKWVVPGRMYALLLAGANAGEPHLAARWLEKVLDWKKERGAGALFLWPFWAGANADWRLVDE